MYLSNIGSRFESVFWKIVNNALMESEVIVKKKQEAYKDNSALEMREVEKVQAVVVQPTKKTTATKNHPRISTLESFMVLGSGSIWKEQQYYVFK